jgi:anti-sigma regulatory factor (Ser/Thr protein kinase)
MMAPNDNLRPDAVLRESSGIRPAATPRSVVMELRADPVVLADVRLRIQEWVGPESGDEDLAMYQVAVTEAVTNAIESHRRAGSDASIVVTIDPAARLISVEDQGGGMARDAGAPADEPPPPQAFRGRGLMIMRSICPDLVVVDTATGSRVELPFPS